MESIDYPLLPVHREQHARVLSALHHARAALDQGGRKSARRLLELLPVWLEVHISTLDASLAACCKAAPGLTLPA
jgi:hemerythrin